MERKEIKKLLRDLIGIIKEKGDYYDERKNEEYKIYMDSNGNIRIMENGYLDNNYNGSRQFIINKDKVIFVIVDCLSMEVKVEMFKDSKVYEEVKDLIES